MKPEATPERIMAFRAATGLPVLQAKEFMASHSTDLVDRILKAAAARIHLPDVNALATVTPDLLDRIFHAAEMRKRSRFLTDPIEEDPDVGPTVRRVLDETTEVVTREAEGQRRLGLCHRVWGLTKERLSREHGITWYSPSEMNPGSCFD